MTSSTGGEYRGKTVEEAIQAGLDDLRLKRDQVNIEILSRGSRGLLGFGAEEARVLISPAAEPEPPIVKAVTVEASPAKAPEPPSEVSMIEELAPEDGELDELSVEDIAVELLQGMLDRMDVRATVQVVEHQGVLDVGQEPPLVLNIEGDDLGILIGRRGETLAAIQYLTRLMINHRARQWTNLVVDVESYKARREEQLVRLAERMADRAVSTGRAVALEAMPARERRIVHIALRNHEYVSTQSVGEGDHRKVTIVPKE